MWPALLLRALPYVLAASLGAFGMRYWDSLRYSKLKGEYSQYQAQVALANEASEKAAREALQHQQDERLAAEDRNTQIIEALKHENLSITAAHTGAERVLANACKTLSTPSGDKASAIADKPGAPSAPDSQSAGRLATDIGGASLECRDAIERLSALQAELIPQLHNP